jgi:mRNA-degrading endonuclease RelE of RelBE toxin-antitoxin system
MSYKVQSTPNFDKEFKRLFKKYPSLKNELIALVETLSETPTLGTSLGNNVYIQKAKKMIFLMMK